VISRALAESKTDAREISYIEAHGTEPSWVIRLKIAALNKAFQQHTQEMGFCLIGSAKSNIGHCESAAGIAGLTKVLLQMQHRQIVPSLHSMELNPHIDFAKSPLRLIRSCAHGSSRKSMGERCRASLESRRSALVDRMRT